jgi:tetratricopeptide (TPR) repeat protein
MTRLIATILVGTVLSVVILLWVSAYRHSPELLPHSMMATSRPASLASGLGNHHHAISTSNAEAQRFFDQGLTYYYAFNHDEAVRSFERAAELDPRSAMAAWGIALALGPGFHGDADPARAKANVAYEAVRKAMQLAKAAPELERAYVRALAKRSTVDARDDLQHATNYKVAMSELAKQYPDDLDAATLFAESALRLHNWQIWSADGKPTQDAEEIIAALEAVLRRDPAHIGANHYYVHALEASPHPEWALPSAERLKDLAPAAGHLLHMPSHIYIRIGEYEKAAQQNEIAVAADEAYLHEGGALGHYLLHYYSHNLTFLAITRAMQGRFADAWAASEKLVAFLGPHVHEIPMLETSLHTPLLTLIRFRRWDQVLKYPVPTDRMATVKPLCHFARGMAFAAAGDAVTAEKEQGALLATTLSQNVRSGRRSPFLAAAAKLLEAKIAAARHNQKLSIDLLQAAVKEEDDIAYHDPPLLYLHVRESLGGALLLNGSHAEAETVFRDDLQRNPRNGRSLFGLLESLKGQRKDYASWIVRRRFEAAWKDADTPLKLEDL